MKSARTTASTNLFAKALELAIAKKPHESSLVLAVAKEVQKLEVRLGRLALRATPDAAIVISKAVCC